MTTPSDAGTVNHHGPDPTARTIETLYREITGQQEMADVLMKGIERIVDEKFASVNTQLTLIERQRVEQKKDTKDAVDAALTAQKEAVREQTIASERAIAKSETATSKQLDQMTATFGASIGGVTDLLNDTKDRAGKMETRVSNIETAKQSATDSRTTQRLDTGQIIAFVGVVAVFVSIIVALLARMLWG